MKQMFSHLASVCITLCLVAGTTSAAAAADEQGVQAAIGRFHDALNALFTGDAGPMKAAWSHAADVSYMGPTGGVQLGWKQVERHWELQAAKKLGGRVDPQDVRVIVAAELAVACYVEKGENVIDGRPQPVSIRSTTTFRKEAGEWKVVGHHTDTLAYLQPK